MAGTKTNERPGTRAKASYVRSSAYKAREILNLIRGKSVAEAAEILQFSERGISEDILKVLDSAVANAEHNDNQIADEPVSYTHLRAHETPEHLVCRLLLEKKK